jgi:hypothetical protein
MMMVTKADPEVREARCLIVMRRRRRGSRRGFVRHPRALFADALADPAKQTEDVSTSIVAMTKPEDRQTPVTKSEKSEPVARENAKPDVGSGDGPLKSLGKALADPVRSAADAEEPPDDGSHAPVAPG